MKLKFLIIFIFSATFVNAETYGYTELRNGTPFGECKSYMPNIEYRQFGEKRNISINTSASYNHYTQKSNRQHYSIIKTQKQHNTSYQSAPINGNQTYNKKQNINHSNAVTSMSLSVYNAQLKIDKDKKKRPLSETVAANNIVIETDTKQRIAVDPDNSSTETPDDPTKPMPISDGIIPMLIFSVIYILKLRTKNKG